jgi:acetyl/propionyl-CoA carboxylase alpha subunit
VIKKLLIANRGEIVRRIILACRTLNIKTVAVYSDADKDAFYLQEADEAYQIGPGNPLKSYLNIDVLIEVLLTSGADAVHPGYGFLSEKAAFAEAVTAAGKIWVGPSPQVLRAIESKLHCKKLAAQAGVPVIPGTKMSVTTEDDVLAYVKTNGLPVLLKLDKGGGGKGIELIKEVRDIKEVLERVMRTGTAAFASSECYLEKKLLNPRHIEVQFIADQHGNCVCLGERECSVQRRHQKIIEETPSPVVTQSDRQQLMKFTSSLVLSIGYEGAGTIEFLRGDDGQYYFMEINARLQVEHPVTEMVTGVDIVQTQLLVAAGEELALKQEDVHFHGHAVEARVYAEDPVTFVPSPGKINALSLPKITDPATLRIDHALSPGGTVPPYYDPMLGKVIAWGMSRPEAVSRLREALTNFQIEGIKTTIPTCLKILNHPMFRAGRYDISFIETAFPEKDGSIVKKI